MVWILIIRIYSSGGLGANQNMIFKIDEFKNKTNCETVGKEIVDKNEVKSLLWKNADGTPARREGGDYWSFQCMGKEN